MGCGVTKSSKKKDNDIVIVKTGNREIDEIFEFIAAPLQFLAKINASLKQGFKKLKMITFTYLLTDCTIDDSITALLYALLAGTDGNLEGDAFEIISSPPFILICKEKFDEGFHEAIDAWNNLSGNVKEATSKITEVPNQLDKLKGEVLDYIIKFKNAIEKANFDTLKSLRAAKGLFQNLENLAKAPALLEETKNFLDSLKKAFENLQKLLQDEGLSDLKKIGKEIHKANIKSMRDIVVHYWPDKSRVDLNLETQKNSKVKTVR